MIMLTEDSQTMDHYALFQAFLPEISKKDLFDCLSSES